MYKITPRAHTSDGPPECSFFCAIYGLMYIGVPQQNGNFWSDIEFTLIENPKSIILVCCEALSMRIFSSFKSLWINPLLCKNPIAIISWAL